MLIIQLFTRIHFIKTTHMVLGTRQNLQDSPQLNLKIDDHDISNVTEQKL